MDASELAAAENPDSKKYKVSKETAAAEAERLFDFYDVPLDDDSDNIKANFKKIERNIRLGVIELFETEDGLCVKQTLRKPTKKFSEIKYGVVCGKTKLATKNTGTEDPYSAMYSMLASLSGNNIADFMDVKAPDLGLCESLALVFLKG